MSAYSGIRLRKEDRLRSSYKYDEECCEKSGLLLVALASRHFEGANFFSFSVQNFAGHFVGFSGLKTGKTMTLLPSTSVFT